MRVERWPGGDFELEPGDMVQIRPDTRALRNSADCVYGTLVVGEDGGGQVVKIPSDSPPAMFLGEAFASAFEPSRLAQVLHDGKIINVSALYVEPVK